MSEEYPDINSLFGYSSGDPLGLNKFAEEERLRKEEEERKYRESLLSKVWEPTKWFFDAAILKPAADVYRGLPEEVKQLSGAIPGVGAAQGVSGLSALLGSTIDKPRTESVLDIPDIQNIIGKEALEGPAIAAEQVAPVDIATLGLGGVSALPKVAKATKLVSGLSKAANALDASEGVYGGILAGQGLAEGDLAKAGMGAFRMAMGGMGAASSLMPTTAKGATSETPVSETVDELPDLKLDEITSYEPAQAAPHPSTLEPSPLESVLTESPDLSKTIKSTVEDFISNNQDKIAKARGADPELGGEGLRPIVTQVGPVKYAGGMEYLKSRDPNMPDILRIDANKTRNLTAAELSSGVLHEIAHGETTHGFGKVEKSERLAGFPQEETGYIELGEAPSPDAYEIDATGELELGNLPPSPRAEVNPEMLPAEDISRHTPEAMKYRAQRGEPTEHLFETVDDALNFQLAKEKADLANEIHGVREADYRRRGGYITSEEVADIRKSRAQEVPTEALGAYTKAQGLPAKKPTVDELIEMAKAESQAKGITEPTNQAEIDAAHERMLEEITETKPPSEEVISTPANILRQILDKTEMTTFNRNTLIEELRAKGYDVPSELKGELPKLLDELKNRGWVKEKLGGTYTLQATAPKTLEGIKKGKVAPGAIPEKALPKALEMSKELYEKPQGLPEKPKAPTEEEGIDISTEGLPEKPIPLEQQMKMKLTPDEIKAIGNLFGTTKKKGTAEIPEEVLMAQKAAIKARAKGEKVTEGLSSSEAVSEPGEGIKPPTKPPTELPSTAEGPKPKDKLEKGLIDDITDIPKTFKSAFDISWPGRQGFFLLNRKVARQGMIEGTKSIMPWAGRKNHEKIIADLENRPNAELYKETGLNQVKWEPTEDIAAKSEEFASERVSGLPGFRHSERAFNDAGNLVRANMFDEFANKWQAEGKTFNTHPELYKGLADYLNVLTMRKPLPAKMRQAGWILNKMFFSPMAAYSRLEMINPMWYTKLPKELQKAAARDIGGTLGATVGLLGLVKAGASASGADPDDVDVSFDPAHTQFLRLKVKETYYDLPGLTPMIRTLYRITSGRKATPKGEYKLPGGLFAGSQDLEEAPFGQSAFGELGGFVENKTSPIYQALKGTLKGQGWGGKEYGFSDAMIDLFAPISIEGAAEAGKDYGVEAGLRQLPDFFGISTQTEYKREPIGKGSKGKKKRRNFLGKGY